MKKTITAIVTTVCLLCGCDDKETNEWTQGGLYSIPNDNGSYGVLKILKIDDGGIHVRLYSNQFDERPSNIDPDKLYIIGVDTKPNETMGMGHLPVSKQSFSKWKAQLIKVVPVKQEELEGYKIWLEAKGGYF